ncbi:hypothetical protein RHSIM_Rhsim01G0276300 [Rhododendron simsii]|uniref:Uncharacterized protein n=1 Tax=Rhododendron simsii TaxID=118357 RepID=A0A834HH72_RHOSS|nr:hypothetical protein RHSIM_Rhsim01G0276300 [Rhododendron simsii]
MVAASLKDLADFLPASMATIVSYFSAEVTRGIWKPASMNGTDWPSPGANLAIVEQQIKKILAGIGVDVPSLVAGGSSQATLPLPLAALISLTITYKLDRASERLLFLIGPALDNLAAGCPWPCLPIIASLWAQKVKRWSDFLIFSASRTVFHHNNDAVDQLLRQCFSCTLGLTPTLTSGNGAVGALLGHGFGFHFCGGISPVAPGILYLRVHRAVRNIMFMSEEIVFLLMRSVKDIASFGCRDKMAPSKRTKNGMRYGQLSLATAMTRVKLAATLGASLVWITGGLNLVQALIKETLPSWFISVHKSDPDGTESGGMVPMLSGCALAYFAVLSGTFAWGVDSSSPSSKRRRNVLGAHLEFLASALDGKISLGCDCVTWRAYVSGFVSLMVGCTPMWMLEVDVSVLKRLSKGLCLWNEEELALALLGISGVGTMGAAAELIIERGSSQATLPLPLAALISLTITYKLDRASERLLFLIGPALDNLAAGCPWPCLPIIASLWAQKVKRWSDFLIFSASRTVFHHNNDAVDQLLRQCFSCTLGLTPTLTSGNGAVGALLGHGFGFHFSGGISPVAPGILYLRVHRAVRNIMFMSEEIVFLLMRSVKDIASFGCRDKMGPSKRTKNGMRYGQVSLATAMTRVKLAATLGASLVWITGGLNLVQALIKETLPSWFISVHKSDPDGTESGGMVPMLSGCALAYFAVLSGTFAWGVDSSSPSSKRRRNVLGAHLEFLASALDGKISLGCDCVTWRAYVSGFVSLMVGCTPMWMLEVDVSVLKRLSKGLCLWNEEELALALLGISGVGTMGAAAELIIESESF